MGEMTSIILQGYSYPFAALADVLAYEARQGRAVRIAMQHAGGWVVAGEGLACQHSFPENEPSSQCVYCGLTWEETLAAL